MKPAAFEYHRPRQIEDALSLLAKFGQDGKILAGGVRLMPLMNFRLAQPAHLVDINFIDGLDYIRSENGSVKIGCLARQSRLRNEPLIRQRCPLLAEALAQVGYEQTRNRGTLCGSLARADPAAGEVADAVDVRVLHRLEHALGRSRVLGLVDGGDDPVEQREILLGDVDLAVHADVRLDAGEDRELREAGAQPLDLLELGVQAPLAEVVRVVGDGVVVVAARDRPLEHLLERALAVGRPVRVRVQVAAHVGDGDEGRQLAAPRRLELARVLPQLRRDRLVAEELVQLVFGRRAKHLTGLDRGDAVLGDREPTPHGVLPHRDVVVLRTGEVLVFGDEELEAEVLGRGEYGMRRVLLRAREGSVASAIDRLGHVPLPPYVSRPDEAEDRETYQTVYAKVRGAVAAPTAGFHFTQRIFDALRERKIEICEITLHVGPGTFRPVQTERVEDHQMESEYFEISEAAAATINKAVEEGRRVIAVGTTSVRTLESAALKNEGKIAPARGETDLFIVPGFRFQVIRGLLTNFHLPKSTLLMLVSAVAGRELIFRAYRHAIRERYRFYSYGDCMLIV